MARRRARSLALAVLFQIDVGKADPAHALEACAAEAAEDAVAYARTVVDGVLERLDLIDAEIADRLEPGWTIGRMPAVDRNVLRIALYELMAKPKGVPAPVAVDEAVELAKTYGAEDAPKFVNGILGRYLRDREGTARGEAD